MLLPLETIAIILYLASISSQSASKLNLTYSLLSILAAGLFCLLLVGLQTILLLKREKLYTKRSRLLISICSSANKALGCIAAIIILHYYAVYNIYNFAVPKLSGNYLLQNITGMLIYIFIAICCWLPWFYLHRRTNPGSWTLWSYLLHRFRYTFFILGLWLPGIVLNDYLDSEQNLISGEQLEIISTALFLLLAWVFPLFLRKFWGCTPLEDQELKKQIQALTAKAGVKIKGIYLWNLGGKSIPNAAMVGFLPPFQYLFISHGLVNRLREDEILGVIAHEIGHLKKRHILFYLLMSITVLSACEPLISIFLQNRIYVILGLIGVFFLYIRFVFAWFSRRFEREADLFSAELLKDFRPLWRGLERIGLAYGNMRSEASWHHYGIAERTRFLEESYYNGTMRKHFKRNLNLLRLAALAVFICLLTLIFYPSHPIHSSSIETSDYNSETHHLNQQDWLEIKTLLGKHKLP